MKLSNETLNVLKNFSTINSGLEFREGNTLSTISSGKTILAKAVLKDSFPEKFCIFDLNQFLSVLSLHKDADIGFDASNVIFRSGRSETKYRKTAREMIVTVPDKELKLPDVDVSFHLTEDDFVSIIKIANVLQSPNIAVESDGDKIFLTAFNSKDDSAHVNSVEVADGNGKRFKAVLLTENLKLISGSYDISLSSAGFSHFKNTSQDIEYFIAIEAKDSKFDN